MATSWLRAASIVTGDGQAPLYNYAIGLEGDQIVDLRPSSKAPADATDFGDASIVPGFVDAHVHLIFDYKNDHESTREGVVSSSRDYLLMRAYRNGLDCLRGGVTTVRDLGDRDGIVASVRDLVRAEIIPGPRIHSAGTPITITGGHCGWLGGRADSPAEIVALTRLLASRGHEVIKVMASGGNMTRESNKTLPQFSVDDMKLIVEEAHRGGVPVASHAHNSEAVRRSIIAGVDTVEHCGWFDASGKVDLTDHDIQSMRESGAIASLTMAGIARQLLPNPELLPGNVVDVAKSMSPSGGDLVADFEWARRMMRGGVTVLISSDAGVRFTPFTGFLQSIRAGMVALDVTASEAIRLSTSVPARALREDHIGTLEPGKKADLVVLGTPLTEESKNLGPVQTVMRNGEIVASEGKVTW